MKNQNQNHKEPCSLENAIADAETRAQTFDQIFDQLKCRYQLLEERICSQDKLTEIIHRYERSVVFLISAYCPICLDMLRPLRDLDPQLFKDYHLIFARDSPITRYYPTILLIRNKQTTQYCGHLSLYDCIRQIYHIDSSLPYPRKLLVRALEHQFPQKHPLMQFLRKSN